MDETTNETTNTSPSGSSSKLWWIIGGAAVILVIGAFFGRGMWSVPYVPGADIDRNLDGSMTYTSENGTVTVGGQGTMPSNWPSDAPTAYSGANIVYSGTSNPTTGENGSAVSYTVSATPEAIVEYYRTRLEAAGWTIVSTSEVSGMSVIAAQKDTRTFGVYIGSDGEGTTSVTAGVQL